MEQPLPMNLPPLIPPNTGFGSNMRPGPGGPEGDGFSLGGPPPATPFYIQEQVRPHGRPGLTTSYSLCWALTQRKAIKIKYVA